MKRIVVGGLIIVVAVAAAVILFSGKGSAPKYVSEPVSRGDIVMSISATGTVNPVTTVQVGTQVSGKIKTLYADYNSEVTKGELIAEIDPALLQAAADQAKANLANARANLVKSRATLVDAQRTRDRYRELLARHLVSQSDLDTAETNYETAKATVDASQTQIDQAQAALDQARTNLFYTRIISPVNGTVISRNVDIGQTVAASFQTPTLFLIGVDLTKMQVDTSVDEADIGSIAVGQDVEFTVDAFPDETFRGKVFQVRNAAVSVQNVVTYDVVVQVGNPKLKLRPGMTANVSIITARVTDALRIPNAALRFTPPLPAGTSARRPTGGSAPRGSRGPAVWVLDKGQPRRVAVMVGISDGNFTQVVSGSVKAGEEVITEALTKLKSVSTAGPRIF